MTRPDETWHDRPGHGLTAAKRWFGDFRRSAPHQFDHDRDGHATACLSRRTLMGISGLALADLLTRQAWAASGTKAKAVEPHFVPRAKRMIFILLDGGLSQVDSYDYKPRLQEEHGQFLPESIKKPKRAIAAQRTVEEKMEQLIPGATLVSCTGFGDAVVGHMRDEPETVSD